MKIKIYEDRSYSRENFSNEGTENENLATTLYFQFPETVNGVQTSTLNKYIVFDINGEPNTDILTSNNSYSIPTAITQLGTVSFNIYLVAPTNNGEDSPFRWISKKITLNFNDANDMTEIVITVEEINIFNSLLSELNSAIANIELLEDDFEEFKKDYDELKDDFEEINRNYQAAISQVENVNIDAIKTGSTATVTITNKEGTEKTVEIQDGTDYIITQNDYQEIANVVENDITPLIPTKTSDIINNSGFIDKEVNNLTNYTLKTSTGSSIELSINSSTYVMTLNLKNSAGTTISTGTVDLPLETMVVGAAYDNTNKKIVLTLKNGSTIDVPVADLVSGLQSEITNANKLSADLVDDTSTTHKFTSTSEKNSWNAKYDKPSGGIPSTDLSSDVQTSLGKADTALQSHQDISGKEDKSNKTNTLNSESTSTQYPNAEVVYNALVTRDEEIEKLNDDLDDIRSITTVTSKNILNPSYTNVGYGRTWNTGEKTIGDYVTFEFIPIELNRDFYFSRGNGTTQGINALCCFDNNKNFISNSMSYNQPLKITNSNVKYISITISLPVYNAWKNTLMLEYDSLSTTYKPYFDDHEVIKIYDNVLSPFEKFKNINICATAHQGLSNTSQYYGNSRLSSIINASNYGFDFCETDIVFTSDNIPVCSHDTTFTDTETSEIVDITSKTLAQLKEYNYFGEKIATFEEVLNACKVYGMGCDIDHVTEATEGNVNTLLPILLNIVQKYNMQDNVRWTCGRVSVFTEILNWYKKSTICVNLNNMEGLTSLISTYSQYATDFNHFVVTVNYSNFSVNDVITIRTTLPPNFSLSIWTIDDENIYQQYLPYCDILVSNKLSPYIIKNNLLFS